MESKRIRAPADPNSKAMSGAQRGVGGNLADSGDMKRGGNPLIASRILSHISRAKSVMWMQLGATAKTLQSHDDAAAARVFASTSERLARVLQMHNACLESQRVLDAAQAGLLIERKAFSNKLEAIAKVCRDAESAGGISSDDKEVLETVSRIVKDKRKRGFFSQADEWAD